jgi:hypothetical protein
MGQYNIYGITNYDEATSSASRYEVFSNYTLISSGTGAIDQSFSIAGYSGFAIFIDEDLALNQILLNGKALYTDSGNAIIDGNLTWQYGKDP